MQRFDKHALGAIHEHIHNVYLERFVPPGSRVLEIGAGPGRFTQTLHRLGCRVVVADISAVQLALNRRYGSEYGFASSVEAYERWTSAISACCPRQVLMSSSRMGAVELRL